MRARIRLKVRIRVRVRVTLRDSSSASILSLSHASSNAFFFLATTISSKSCFLNKSLSSSFLGGKAIRPVSDGEPPPEGLCFLSFSSSASLSARANAAFASANLASALFFSCFSLQI